MKEQDLEKLWDEHTKYEFATPDVEATLATMVEDAYVNHVPVMTGGKGKTALRAFYGTDFIPCMPPDFKITRVSRTVGENRLVDEMVISFTHTIEMPWILPVAIVGFRDGKLAHENIYWDQASVLKQIGLLSGEGLPMHGAETARKVLELQA
ncbi:MAG TPA: hypothetical protein VK684_08365 [Edaphobacter sp.]|nr:hypothetical protein [Edaphobacter sp.]